jgi:hypothetical protein
MGVAGAAQASEYCNANANALGRLQDNQRLGHVTRDAWTRRNVPRLIPYRVDLNIPGSPYSAQTSRRAIDICLSFGIRRRLTY